MQISLSFGVGQGPADLGFVFQDFRDLFERRCYRLDVGLIFSGSILSNVNKLLRIDQGEREQQTDKADRLHHPQSVCDCCPADFFSASEAAAR
ncbi:hypothetical protein [Deinococcus ruber]|uniref:Uncharacterized protein n=1 Tax=Deinococcus ruber TaxID=1848197 RepID=A0A918BU76_9DEIO|nr:hypothetical protein [Deinococcus ruber]GGQ92326.1 hypothetical protein GCM10008957_00300 [Deinococcus ruber]